jgi:xanthine dehydrogenase small subunit
MSEKRDRPHGLGSTLALPYVRQITMSKNLSSSPPCHPLRFWRKGQLVTLDNVASDRTLLELLREDLRSCDTKEGCAAGDCGACTVVVAQAQGPELKYSAINSCIRPAHAIDGMALWTAADLSKPDGSLHPVQQAMVSHHGSQCGFCTPGFVMSLFALYQRTHAAGKQADEVQIHDAISGNLCRCTGYRPIVEAAHHMDPTHNPEFADATIVEALRSVTPRDNASAAYALPTSLEELLKLRAQRPDAQLIAGATDTGLWITQQLRHMPQVIELTRVTELRAIVEQPEHLAIGAAVSLQEAFEALTRERPKVQGFAQRFAGWPVRQSGTMGGNVANGSPIGDSMPLLIALGAQITLSAWREGRLVEREMPLESLYTGYRQNVMAADEVLTWIKVPRPKPNEWLGIYKVSKRVEDDISAVCLAICFTHTEGQINQVRIGAGGVAATPARARATEAALQGGAAHAEAVWERAKQAIREEFKPLSDLRASASYRQTLLTNLLERARLAFLNQESVALEDWS